jgi:hypothetical protein
LLGSWGLQLSPADVEEIKISAVKAMQVAAKYMMLKFLKSQRIIGKQKVL